MFNVVRRGYTKARAGTTENGEEAECVFLTEVNAAGFPRWQNVGMEKRRGSSGAAILSALGAIIRPVAVLCVLAGLFSSWTAPAQCGERHEPSAHARDAASGHEGEGESHGAGHADHGGNAPDDCAQPPALPASHTIHTKPVALAPAPSRPLLPEEARREVPQPVPIVLPDFPKISKI